MEEFDPTPFVADLNQHGLKWHVKDFEREQGGAADRSRRSAEGAGLKRVRHRLTSSIWARRHLTILDSIQQASGPRCCSP